MDLLKPDLHLKISNLQIDQTVTKSGAIIREFSIGHEATEVHNGEFVEATVYLNPILPGNICHLSIKM